MDSVDKGMLAIGASAFLIIGAFIGYATYTAHLRAQVINESPDPLYAACAFDSGGRHVPPSCFTLLTQNKDLPR